MRIKKISYQKIPGIYYYDNLNHKQELNDYIKANGLPLPERTDFDKITVHQGITWYKGLNVHCLFDDDQVRIIRLSFSVPDHILNENSWNK